MLHVACCMLHVACCMLHVACCMLHVVRQVFVVPCRRGSVRAQTQTHAYMCTYTRVQHTLMAHTHTHKHCSNDEAAIARSFEMGMGDGALPDGNVALPDGTCKTGQGEQEETSCGARRSARTMQHATCNMQHASRITQHARCSMQHAERNMQWRLSANQNGLAHEAHDGEAIAIESEIWEIRPRGQG